MAISVIPSVSIPADEQECIALFKAARWPDGYRCPRCGCADHREISSRRLPLFECLSCRYQCSLTAGTILERSRVPLRKWLQAIEIMAVNGMTANRLCELIGVTYKTAWLMMHKLRDAIARSNDGAQLSGTIRFDIGILGRHMIPSRNGLHPNESPIIIGGSIGPDGRVQRIMALLDTGGDTYSRRITSEGIGKFIDQYVAPAYSIIDDAVDRRGWTTAPELYESTSYILSGLSRFCGVWRKNLPYYIQEHVYRWNARLSGQRSFPLLLSLAARHSAPTVHDIASRVVPGRPDWRPRQRVIPSFADINFHSLHPLSKAASY